MLSRNEGREFWVRRRTWKEVKEMAAFGGALHLLFVTQKNNGGVELEEKRKGNERGGYKRGRVNISRSLEI